MPPPIHDRLATARERYLERSGSLIEALAGPAAAARTAPAKDLPSAWHRAAAAALAAERAAERERAVPILGALPYRRPALAPRSPHLEPAITPSYADPQAAPPGPGDLEATSEAPLSAPILEQAAALGYDYARIYDFVRNDVATEWYAGSLKGAEETLRQRSGNDVDQASLLLALLRASGLACRYVQGVLRLPLATVATSLGLADPVQVPAALARAGVPHRPVIQGGRLTAVDVEHTWVAAYAPYANYRGAVVDFSGATWIPLAPALGETVWTPATGVLDVMGFDAEAFVAEALAAPQELLPAAALREEVEAYLASQGAGATYGEQLARREPVPLRLELLPPTIAAATVAVTAEKPALEDADRHVVRLLARSGTGPTDPPIFDATLPAAALAGHRVTLSYTPATVEDDAIVNAYGGLDQVPCYLVELRPQLKVDGHLRAVGEGAIDMGVPHRFEVTLLGPHGSETVARIVVSGTYHALALDAQAGVAWVEGPPDPGDTEGLAARLLARIGADFAARWGAAEQELADLAGLALVRPLPSLAVVDNAVAIETLFDLPFHLVWQGVTLDALVRAAEPLPPAAPESAAWLELAALEGSALEHAVFEEDFLVESISADEGLGRARAAGIPVHAVDAANLATELEILDHPPFVEEAVGQAALLGYEVEIPETALQHEDWRGSLWRVRDPASRGAGYFLAGGLAGGATAQAPENWVLDFLADALAAPYAGEPNTDPLAAASISKLAGTDGLEGTVGLLLGKRLEVLVRDAAGRPVEGAPVTFTSIAGGGGFVDLLGGEHSVMTVVTGALGGASVAFALGEQTAANPVLRLRLPSEVNATQALLHLIDVWVPTHDGVLFLSVPFTALGWPDSPERLRRADTTETHFTFDDAGIWADTPRLVAEDRFGNPVSNVAVELQVGEMVTDPSCTNANPDALNAAVFALTDPACLPVPVPGACGEESLLRTSSYEPVGAGVLLGTSFTALYRVAVTSPDIPDVVPLEFSYSVVYNQQPGGTCDPSFGASVVRMSTVTYGDDEDRNIQAAEAGRPYELPIDVALTALERDWGWVCAPDPGGGCAAYDWGPLDSGDWVPAHANLEWILGNGASATPAEELEPYVGIYRTELTTGPAPGENTLTGRATETTAVLEVLCPSLPPPGPQGILPEFCQDGQVAYTYEETYLDFEDDLTAVWGLRPVLVGVAPSPIVLSPAGETAEYEDFAYTLEPPEYRALAAEVDLVADAAWLTTLPGSSREAVGKAVLARGFPLDLEEEHAATLVVNRGGPFEVRSAAREVPLAQPLLRDVEPVVLVTQDVDLVNQRSCPQPGTFSFGLNQEATVTLTARRLEAVTPEGEPVLGGEQTLLDALLLPAGDHSFTVAPTPDLAADITLPPGDYRLTLSATSTPTGLSETRQLTARSLYSVHDDLPVGHVLVEGVDLWDGHLVLAREDLRLPGRGPAIELTRTYSSAAAGEPGPLGVGWTHAYDARLLLTPCGELILAGGDGSGARFVDDGAGGLRPLKGFHGTLLADPADLSFDFYSKDGTRYHYFPGGDGVWRLDFIADPNGNTTDLVYDPTGEAPRLAAVVDPGGRQLLFEYETKAFEVAGDVELWQGAVVSRVAGPEGFTLDFSYDAYGNLVRADREGGARGELYAYATMDDPLYPAGRRVLTAVTDALDGGTSRYDYVVGQVGVPGAGIEVPRVLVAEVTRPMGGTTSFAYDLAGLAARTPTLVAQVTDARGFTTTYTLDAYGSPLAIVDPLGNSTTMTWDPDDVVMLARTDANGATTTYTYDEHANLTAEQIQVRDVDGGVHAYSLLNSYAPPTAFDPPYLKERLASRTDRNGHTTTFEYDLHGNLLRTAVVGTAVETRHTYLGNGDRASTTDPNGNTTLFGYDVLGNLALTRDPLGGESTAVWNARSLPIERHDALGRVTTLTYDTLGRLTATARPLGAVETIVYDDVANTETRTDAEGRVRISRSDLEGRVVEEVDPAGARRRFEYDGVGNKSLESLWFDDTTPRADVTYEYDEAGRLLRRTEPLGRRTQYQYDGVGSVLRETLLDSSEGNWPAHVTESDYDELNRRIRQRRLLGGAPVERTFLLDGEGNLLRETDPLGRTTTRTYDALDRLLEILEPEGKATRNTWDRNGNLVREERENEPADQVREFAYDALNRLVRRTDAAGADWLSEYDAVGNLTREIDPRLDVTTHDYDALDRKIRTIRHLNRTTVPAREVETAFTYDKVGNLTAEAWPNGNLLQHAYDGLDRLTATTDGLGPVVAYTYDARGNRTSMTDANGNLTTNTYDSLDRLVAQVLPEDRTLAFTYDVAGNRTSETDARGNTTSFEYDALDRLLETTDPPPFGYRMSYEYDLAGNKTAETDRRGNRTSFAYDDLNRLTQISDPDPLGTTVAYEYDQVGNRVRETDRRGILTQFEYDGENRLTRLVRDGLELRRLEYDAAGNLQFEHDANGNVTGFEYDERNLLVAENRPLAAITSYELDDMGDRAAEIDPEGRRIERAFDLRRRLGAETNGAGETTASEYDNNSNKTAETKPLGTRWEYDFDSADRLVAVRDPLGNETTYEYDGAGNRTSQRDAEGRLTTYEFDELDRRVRMEYPDGAAESYGWDENGNQVSRTDATGRTTTSTYDERNRKVLDTYPLPSPPTGDDLLAHAFTYDGNDNPTRIEETYSGATGTRVTTRSFDTFDRLTSTTDPFGETLAHTYDANGNRTFTTDPDGKVTRTTYDALNRAVSTLLPGGGTATYEYFKDSRPKRITFPNAIKAATTYDGAGRVLAVAHTLGAATVSRYDYLYDANGNRTQQIEQNGGAAETTTYGYDDADRLTDIAYPDQFVSYTYDAVGNRLSEHGTDGAGTTILDRLFTYNARDQLEAIDDLLDPAQSIAYTYDANGNQVGKQQGAVATTFAYDVLDRLTQVTEDGSLLGRYAYDWTNLRIEKQDPSGTTRYLWDDTAVLLETDEAGATRAKYDYGPDRLLALTHATEGRSYYLHDALGSIAALARPDGTLAARYQWDAWGRPRSQAGSSPNPFAFTGHQRDEATGLYYAKARYYDEELGRFLTQDPFAGAADTPPSLHKYLYAHANPTAYVDPDGESATAVGTLLGFAWGVGQSLGALINDAAHANLQSAGKYLSVLAQNTIGGLELGASVDIAIASGGTLAATASGALGAAGLDALTLTGQGVKSWSDFGKSQLADAGMGALGGAVLSKAAPVVSRAARAVAQKVPAVARAGEAVAAQGRRVVEAVRGSYVRTSLDDAIEAIDRQTVQSAQSSVTSIRAVLTGEGASGNVTAAGASTTRGVAPQASSAPSTRARILTRIAKSREARAASSFRRYSRLDELYDPPAQVDVPRGTLPPPSRVPNAGGVIRSFVTEQDEVFFRVFSGDARTGGFLVRARPGTRAQAIEGLALPPGNEAQFIQEVLVPAGTRLQRSRALPAFGRRGGMEQFELLDLIPEESFGPGVPFQ
jgi:RHS repeat-associated protein